MGQSRFATSINCIDGRVHHPVAEWLKQQYDVEYVDQITEPGPDRVLSTGTPDQLAAILEKTMISVQAHGSHLIAIVGHHDCAGNPVSEDEHRLHICRAAATVEAWALPVEIIGLWVNADWEVEVVCERMLASA